MQTHTYEVRVLTSNVKNPRGDMRFHRNWLAKPVWNEGMRVLIQLARNQKKIMTTLSNEFEDFYFAHEGSPPFELVMSASEALSPEEFTCEDVQAICLNVYDCTNERILMELTNEGIIKPLTILNTVAKVMKSR